MDSVLIIGLGEVGRAIYELVLESKKYRVYGIDIDPSKSINGIDDLPSTIEYLHICYPYTDSFVENTVKYIETFHPTLTIIHSTVAPSTTRAVFEQTRLPVAYSPVRGKHPHIKTHLRFWTKWVATLPEDRIEQTRQHLSSIGLRVRVTSHPETLELAKLFETVYRALMIAFWQEAHRVTMKYRADISEVAEFIHEVHTVLGDRPVYYPGYIGGHCLIPNTEIVNNVDPSPLWDFILQSNKKRLKEQQQPEIQRDIEKVKKIWEKTAPKWYIEGHMPEENSTLGSKSR